MFIVRSIFGYNGPDLHAKRRELCVRLYNMLIKRLDYNTPGSVTRLDMLIKRLDLNTPGFVSFMACPGRDKLTGAAHAVEVRLLTTPTKLICGGSLGP